MSFLDAITESARRLANNDGWYVKNEPYILELRSAKVISGLPTGIAFMVLPLGPENYKVSRVFRQSVTPTMGGLVAEEQGILWRMITVSGTFGLEPKFGVDTSLLPDATFIAPVGGVLSGPAWTRRMVNNYFEKYGELKADPLTASQTELVWHDTKTGDSWVVVPESIDIDRTVARRGQYPWSFQLKGIGKDSLRRPIPPLSDLNALGKSRDVIAKVNQGLALANSAVQEGSLFLSEVRYYVATIDSVLDKIATITTSAQSFVDGVTDTINVGASFISSTAAATQDALDLMETVTQIPDSIRQNYQMALDGIHLIASQTSAFGQSYPEVTASIAIAEAGAGRADALSEDGTTTALIEQEAAGPSTSVAEFDATTGRSTDQTLVTSGALTSGRTFGTYSGFRDYVITSVDTLQSIASQLLGDGALWYDIAIVNDLKAPYLNPARIPGTVWTGDTISIPVVDIGGENAIVGEGSEPGADLLGTDIALTETSSSIPGKPSVDIAWDEGTLTDVRVISGFNNLAQAIQLRLWTERGSMPLAPGYGLKRTIGIKSTDAFLTLLRLNYAQTLRQDSRISRIGRIVFEASNDVVEVDVDIVPKGAATSRAVRTSLV